MFVRLLSNRIIKIFANCTKFGCYVVHVFAPNLRFTLPKHASPLCGRSNTLAIPNILWQTNYTNRVTLALYINYLFNRLLSPTFEYRFVITEDRANFIKSNYSQEIYALYSKIQIGAAQADFWRVLVLQKHGGVYLDIDAHFVWPLHWLIRPEYKELYIVIKRGDISNYFIASAINNVHLKEISDIIVNNIRESTLKNVYDLTGPGVFNQVLDREQVPTSHYRYTCNQGSFTNEFFQYIDKPQGKWTKAQEKIDIIKQ